MGKWDGLDRRRFPRIKYPCLIVLRSSKENKDVFLTHTENVGIGGVCIILKKNIKMFTPVEIELDLLNLDKHIKCNGKVVWNVQRKSSIEKKPLHYDVGVEFQDILEKDRERLENTVRKLSQEKKNLAA